MIQEAIRQAQQMHRRALEATYEGRCSIYKHVQVRNPDTKLMEPTEIPVDEDMPCKLSFSSISATQEGEMAAVSQEVKLFCAPELQILPGSKLVITQAGVTETYERTGLPAVYLSHQEIALKPFKGWA